MISISVCMIVKDEEKLLSRCLDCVKYFADEIIIVDTGSKDNTKNIAKKYKAKIYDFKWIDDFSAARNFSFSKATKDYIYVADADEVIDNENIKKIIELKKCIIPEVDIVQMYYTNQLEYGTTYNFDEELRPKLYKRIRKFNWIEKVHERVNLEPAVYDSDIKVKHMPESNHSNRDFNLFKKIIQDGQILSKHLNEMYAKELYICGEDLDFIEAYDYFKNIINTSQNQDILKQAMCIVVKASRLKNDIPTFISVCLKSAVSEMSSEVCYEIGEFYYNLNDYKEASIWFYNSAYETECILNIKYDKQYPVEKLALCYEKLGNLEQAQKYRDSLK